MDNPMRDKKCPKCNAWRFPAQFIKNSRLLKTCDVCRDRGKKYNEQHRDEINEYYKQYNEQHRDRINERQKQYHEQQKQNQPLQHKLKRMIENSKQHDKKNNLTIDEENYINMDFLTDLWIQQNGTCFYQNCGVELDYESFDKNQRKPTLLTIQRHNNNISHEQSNVCFACYDCNCRKRKELQQFNNLLQASESLTLQ